MSFWDTLTDAERWRMRDQLATVKEEVVFVLLRFADSSRGPDRPA